MQLARRLRHRKNSCMTSTLLTVPIWLVDCRGRLGLRFTSNQNLFNLIHLIIFFWIDNCFEGDLCQNRALEKRDGSQTDQMEPINFELESNLWL